MKYLLLLLPIVLISLCSILPPFPSLPQPETFLIDPGSPDLYIKAETTSSEIRGGREVQVFFELRNKQLYDLNNVNLIVYDYPCFDVATNKFLKDDCGTDASGTLKANQTCMWHWRWKSEESEIDRRCIIKFFVAYSATSSVFQDIVVLSESEYVVREVEGTLQDIPIQSTFAKGPLNVYLTFSESQPFIADLSGYDMYINYNNRGDGFFDNLDIKFTAPNNIIISSCPNYTSSGGTFTLNKDLKFIKGRAVPTICEFSTAPQTIMSIKSLNMDIGYKYTLYNHIPITVKGEKPTTPTPFGGGGGCLIEGFKVLTPEGFKRIEDLKVGDTVIGYKDGKKVETKVKEKTSHFGFWDIYFYNGNWFTWNHKVFPSLNEEAVLVSLVSNKINAYTGYVYNIETEAHNYFGENDLLIHNAPIAKQ
ncbi:MAG: hypothetical protein GTN40_00760 [Candidatus Aenigmarchaeota archaeon]|nr:hypothetical protein [Candidatus Aenigmarchaeota archaeon]